MRSPGRTVAAVILLLMAASLACSVSYSTAHFDDPRLTRDATGARRVRSYAADATFYLVTEIKDADDPLPIKVIWRFVDPETGEKTVLNEHETEAGNGDYVFELSHAEDAWTPGTYEVALYLDGHHKKTLSFEVK